MGRETSPNETPSVAVVKSVAADRGIDPTELDCLLADAIDPIALDALFEPAPGGERNVGVVEFEFCDRIVAVRTDGTVSVRETAE